MPTEWITGVIYLTSKHRSDLTEVAFGHLKVRCAGSLCITGSGGYYDALGAKTIRARLEGVWCSIFNRQTDEAGRFQVRYSGRPSFEWCNALGVAPDDAVFRDLMAYYHVTSARVEFDSLLPQSLKEELRWGSWLREARVIVDETYSERARSVAWNYTESQFHFGSRVSWVLDSLVIFHEYAHAVIDLITGESLFPSASEDGLGRPERLAAATCEAYADYLACSLKNYPVILKGGSYARDLRRCARYDPDSESEPQPHRDSLPLSTGLWALRRRLGKSTVDRLVIHTLAHGGIVNFREFTLSRAAEAIGKADEETNAGRHVLAIRRVFHKRGLL